MVGRIDAYVDTSALIAFLDRSDSHHPLFRKLFSSPPALVTTTLVLAEGHGWFLRRYDRIRGLQFLSLIESLKPLKVLAVGPDEVEGGTKILRKYSDQHMTLTDGVGLHVMHAGRARSCWSTDFHMGLTGVPLVVELR